MGAPDVLLISPPFDFSVINSADGRTSKQAGYYLYYPPIGLCSIGAALGDSGFTVEVLDGQVDCRGSMEETASAALRTGARIIGIGATTPALPVVHSLVGAIKRERPDTCIAVGGPHVSCDPEIINGLGADYGIAGDGEEPMAALAAAVLRGEGDPAGIPGVAVPGFSTPPEPALSDLASLAPPDRRLLKNPDLYFNPFVNTRTTLALTARGCPFHCSFCCRTPSMGTLRALPHERAMAELVSAASANCGFVSIIDETFTFDRERALRIARDIRARRLGFQWSCQTRADLVDAELLREFRAAGCINISFGVEAGDQRVRDSVEKKISDADFERAFSAARAAGLTINAFLIIGSPGETTDQMEKSISRVIELAPDYAVFNVGTLFPGTREYEKRLAAGEVDRSVWDAYMRGETELPVLSRELSKEVLAEMLRRAYSRFYLRPGYVLKKMASIRSLQDVAVLARQARTVVSDYVKR